jgi:hypothetical protein
MPCDGAIIFGNLIGKLGMRRIECPKCGRSGKRLSPVLWGSAGSLFFPDPISAS